jgi:hypothetical protein
MNPRGQSSWAGSSRQARGEPVHRTGSFQPGRLLCTALGLGGVQHSLLPAIAIEVRAPGVQMRVHVTY